MSSTPNHPLTIWLNHANTPLPPELFAKSFAMGNGQDFVTGLEMMFQHAGSDPEAEQHAMKTMMSAWYAEHPIRTSLFLDYLKDVCQPEQRLVAWGSGLTGRYLWENYHVYAETNTFVAYDAETDTLLVNFTDTFPGWVMHKLVRFLFTLPEAPRRLKLCVQRPNNLSFIKYSPDIIAAVPLSVAVDVLFYTKPTPVELRHIKTHFPNSVDTLTIFVVYSATGATFANEIRALLELAPGEDGNTTMDQLCNEFIIRNLHIGNDNIEFTLLQRDEARVRRRAGLRNV